jgi:hypothetical protein
MRKANEESCSKIARKQDYFRNNTHKKVMKISEGLSTTGWFVNEK